MELKRKTVPEPRWDSDDFAEASTYDLFSYERWGMTVEWDVLLDQAKKIDSIVLLIDKYTYGSQLFLTYIDILEANTYIFDDLFYYLVGTRIGNEPDPEKFLKKGPIAEIYSRLHFWGLDYRDSMNQIYKQLIQIENHIVTFLQQRRLAGLCNRLANEWSHGYKLKRAEDTLGIIFPVDQAHMYAMEAYKGKTLLSPLVKQMLNILNILDNAIIVFGVSYNLPKNCFPSLLKQFRKSEKGQNLLKAWERDFDGSLDSLITKIEKVPELSPWVHRYHHLHDEEDVIEQLFYDEDSGFLANEEEYYNTKNWISILKIATLLQEYEERQKPQEYAEAPSPVYDERIRQAITLMQKENVIKHSYDFAFVMMIMNVAEDCPSFDSPKSFLTYLRGLKIMDLPSDDSIKKKISVTYDKHPSWYFRDPKGKDATEAKRRNNVASRFLSIYRKGK